MNFEKQFYEHLQQTPELPHDLFDKIDAGISNEKKKRRTILSIAAALLLFIGPAGIAIHRNTINQLDKEVVAELEDIWNFMNGNDIDDELDRYAIIEGY